MLDTAAFNQIIAIMIVATIFSAVVGILCLIWREPRVPSVDIITPFDLESRQRLSVKEMELRLSIAQAEALLRRGEEIDAVRRKR